MTNDREMKIQKLIKAARAVDRLSWVVSPSWGIAKHADQWYAAADKLSEALRELKHDKP